MLSVCLSVCPSSVSRSVDQSLTFRSFGFYLSEMYMIWVHLEEVSILKYMGAFSKDKELTD